MNRREMMKAAGAATVLSALPVWAFAAAQEDPYKWVLSMSNQVLDRIKSEPALRNGDIPAIKKLVDELIMPNVDFTMVTRLTVGPKWRQAKPEQRQQLQDNFRELLIRVYSGALSKVNSPRCATRRCRTKWSSAPSSSPQALRRLPWITASTATRPVSGRLLTSMSRVSGWWKTTARSLPAS